MTKGSLVVRAGEAGLSVVGEMSLDPAGFEIFDDLLDAVRPLGEAGVDALPSRDEVLDYVREEFRKSGLSLWLRSDRLGVT